MRAYSRRELYAAGEPLGDSVTVSKVDGGRIYGGGGSGGGSPPPTQSTSYNTNVPEYARPYVENMLESAQKQIYSDDMTTFRPYQAYSTDVNNYFAGFSPLQQSAQQAAYYMQTPSQIAEGSQLTGLAGLGSLGIAGQAAGAGQQFAQQATNPNAIQSYMSPYMQNVVDYQKSQALRDYQIGQPMRRAQAVGAGAFGGSRQAIMEAEAERALGSQLQGIAAQGSQQAFQDAQRQQQFGAQLGLQGQQAALQGLGQAAGAGTALGGLGTQQLAAQQGIVNLQSQLGGQQQQLEQAKINQAIQDYATAQQYPYMQLGVLNAMLRGLPLQQTTTQTYQAAPSPISQFGGLAATGLGAYGAMGGFKAAGGQIKEYAGGGSVKGYAGDEGSVVSGLDVLESAETSVENLPNEELIKIASTSSSKILRDKAKEVLAMRRTAQMQQPKMPSGIAAAPVPALNAAMAGGGIVAFSGEDESYVQDEEQYNVAPVGMMPASMMSVSNHYKGANLDEVQKNIDRLRKEGGPKDRLDEAQRMLNEDKAARQAGSKAGFTIPESESGVRGLFGRNVEAIKSMGGFGESAITKDSLDKLKKAEERAMAFNEISPYLALMRGGAKAMQSKSPYAMVGLGAGLEEGVDTYGKRQEKYESMLEKVRSGQLDIEKLNKTERTNLLNYALSGAVSEANVIEQGKTRRQTAEIAAQDRAIRAQENKDLQYVTKINELTKAILANKFNPSEADIRAARALAKKQIDEELSLGKPEKGSAPATPAPTGNDPLKLRKP